MEDCYETNFVAGFSLVTLPISIREASALIVRLRPLAALVALAVQAARVIPTSPPLYRITIKVMKMVLRLAAKSLTPAMIKEIKKDTKKAKKKGMKRAIMSDITTAFLPEIQLSYLVLQSSFFSFLFLVLLVPEKKHCRKRNKSH